MAQAAFAKSRFTHIRCLLIEDSEFDQRRIRRVMDQLGIGKLDIVSSVEEARGFLSKHRVNLIVLDNGLPDGDGVDFALEMRQFKGLADVPVVLVSDWPSPFMFDKALKARIMQVLRKDEFNLASAMQALSASPQKTGTFG